MLLLAAVPLWAVPSDMIELIVRQDEVILGRYSETRAYIAILLSPLLLIAAATAWSRVALDRRLLFRVAAVTLSAFVAAVVVDIGARQVRQARYVVKAVEKRDSWPHQWQSGAIKARPPDTRYEVHFEDVPAEARSYPDAPAGNSPVDITLSVDHRGFRNQTRLDEYELVTLGDSFTEGSRVGDDEVWPVRLAKRLETSVYNLGIGGTSPRNYLDNLIAHLDQLNPKTVLCMVYEGNDFKLHDDDLREEKGAIQNLYGDAMESLKNSPVIGAFRDLISSQLGNINADAPVPPSLALSWMPIEIRAGQSSHYYAFQPKRLIRLYHEEAEFAASRGWKNAAEVFAQIAQVCRQRGVRLIFVYAPSKPHVVMPLIEKRLAPQALHEFAAYKKKDIPGPAEFKKRFYQLIDSPEKVFRRFCETEGVEFISPTVALRQHASEGHQVYYTYDSHWNRLGHRVVADTVGAYLKSNPRKEP